LAIALHGIDAEAALPVGHAIERRLTETLAASAQRRVIFFFRSLPAKILWFAYPRR
jgi:hypothetical protein